MSPLTWTLCCKIIGVFVPKPKIYPQIQASSRKLSETQNLVKLSTTADISNAEGDVISGWISHEGFHLIPSFQSAITNLILDLNDKDIKVTATNKPLPEFQDEGDEFRVTEDLFGFVITYIFAGAFIYAVFTQVRACPHRIVSIPICRKFQHLFGSLNC